MTNYDVLSVVKDVDALKANMEKVLGSQDRLADIMNEQIMRMAAITEGISSKTSTQSLDVVPVAEVQTSAPTPIALSAVHGVQEEGMQTSVQSVDTAQPATQTASVNTQESDIGSMTSEYPSDNEYETRSEASIEEHDLTALDLTRSAEWPELSAPHFDTDDPRHNYRKPLRSSSPTERRNEKSKESDKRDDRSGRRHSRSGRHKGAVIIYGRGGVPILVNAIPR